MHTVNNARRSRNKIQIELSLQPLLYDLQMQKSKETATETETKCDRCLRLKA